MNKTIRRLAVGAVASTLVLTGCGRDSDSSADGSTVGVTSEPCPDAVDEDKGCIYLGVISDLTGPFAPVGVPLTAGGKAFWDYVNANGGVGDYEVNVTANTKDNQYNPETHAQAYSQIKGDILAMAQSLGTVATEAMLADSDADELLVVPATLGSNWLFEDRVLEIGTSYCAEAMNAVDYGVDELGAKGVAAVHFPGDYGDDAMVGARIAAEERGVKFTDITVDPTATSQDASVKAVLDSGADLVVISTGPTQVAEIVGGAVASGFKGKFIGSIPTWNAALLGSPAGPALEAAYLWATSFPLWDTDSAGFEAMREANGAETPNDYYALGWSGGYIMKAVLEQAIADDDLTQAGLLAAAKAMTTVESEGMLPEGSGNYAGDPNEAAVRVSQFGIPTKGASTGIGPDVDFFTGPTAAGYQFEEACYLQK
ncbi:ABC transporter substrate-binding protein [Nocardioides sp. R-C-SC26]|uniref:ABC transporter substrate-binding protein n=1 Tax=Nocardioides sp. R-C-SC26 TaxID=2870414 RepID=UPI001E2E4946|nr:ABC transporter substrate-binding protein [Nocardioides sp. R-C-SC26]